MLETVTPAVNNKLTTLIKVKTELQPTTAADDAFLTELIDQASNTITSFCLRPFMRETYRETVTGQGGVFLLLARTPLATIRSVAGDAGSITDFTAWSAAGMLYRKNRWAQGQTYVVEYDAGYADAPGDVERACTDLVKAFFLARQRDPAITNEKIGDYGAAYTQVTLERLKGWRRPV